jgi:hypothetical protein
MSTCLSPTFLEPSPSNQRIQQDKIQASQFKSQAQEIRRACGTTARTWNVYENTGC